jgi:pSer/pThr/pTyr-binding forkhead associated (FHA) protein
MALRLIIEDEEGATTIVPLGEEEITIGREPGNTIQLTEQNVSRQHARLTPGSDGWVIEDLDSYNGVRVNGVLIEGTVNLNEGDVVQIGDYHLAITNNAEQTTLNIERQGVAGSTEPLRAAPSMDLPRIPASEAAVMIAPPPPLPDHSRDRDDDRHTEQPENKGRGLLFALLAVFLIGGGFIAYQFTGGGGRTEAPKNQKIDPPAKVEEPAPQPVEQKTEPKPPEPPPTDPPLPNDPVPEPTTVAPSDPPFEPSEPTEPTKKPPVPKGEKGEKGEKVVKPPPPTKSEKPPVPKGDPVQLLEDARKANLAGNATQAYDLAKKSYDIDKNSNALALMGASACKMGDQAKAKSVFKKLTDPNRQKQMITVCGERGIMLE